MPSVSVVSTVSTEFCRQVVSHLNIQVENLLEALAELSLLNLFNRHVDDTDRQTWVNHDDGKNLDRCGIHLWNTTIGRNGLSPNGKRVSVSVGFCFYEGFLMTGGVTVSVTLTDSPGSRMPV